MVSEYGLTCQYRVQRAIFNALYMVGMLVGSIILGLVADKFGRRLALLVSIILVSSAGAMSAAAPPSWLFGTLRCVNDY